MKLLYLSCHAVLEYDEIRLFHEMGIDVFSPGAYLDPATGGGGMRPPLPQLNYDPEVVRAFDDLGKANHEKGIFGVDNKELLTKDFVNRFDAVMVMHVPHWISNNWHAIKHKPVIWRTIGQSIPSVEESLSEFRKEGLKIVRYSPTERRIAGFIGEDAQIRFYKDPDEYSGWNGINRWVVTLAQSMKERGVECGYDIFEEATRAFPRKLFGSENKASQLWAGKLDYEGTRRMLRNHRVYFYTGTRPASYTLNFIEAWMTGVPIVAIGPNLGNHPGYATYEAHELIEHGVTGFVSDSIAGLSKAVDQLFHNDRLASFVSEQGRKAAIRHFGKDIVRKQWEDFFATLQ